VVSYDFGGRCRIVIKIRSQLSTPRLDEQIADILVITQCLLRQSRTQRSSKLQFVGL